VRSLLFWFLLALVVLMVWLVVSAADEAVDHDSVQVMAAWGTERPPYVVDEQMFTTTTTARARSAPSKQRTTMRAASAAPVGVLQDKIRAGFARFGPHVAEQAIRVAGCESTGDETGQHLDERAVNGQHAGLFQLSRTYHEERARRLGFDWPRMFEAEPNITVAVDLFAEQQWRPWTCRWAA
jgi:hypothetical protein